MKVPRALYAVIKAAPSIQRRASKKPSVKTWYTASMFFSSILHTHRVFPCLCIFCTQMSTRRTSFPYFLSFLFAVLFLDLLPFFLCQRALVSLTFFCFFFQIYTRVLHFGVFFLFFFVKERCTFFFTISVSRSIYPFFAFRECFIAK